MEGKADPLFNRVKKNIRRCIISGIAVIVPVAITIAILKWIFNWLAGFLSPVAERIIMPFLWQKLKYEFTSYSSIIVSIVAIFLLLFLLYLTGGIARLIVGRKLIALGESILLKIPIVKSIYQASKQVVQAFSMPERAAFKEVVIVEFPRPGMYAFGFLTGKMEDRSGRSLYKVFIPTSPNPTTGFLELMEKGAIQFTDISVDEAFKMLISGGILSPEKYSIPSSDRNYCHPWMKI